MDDFPHLLRIHPVIPHDQAPTRFKTKARVTRGRFPALKGRRPTYTSPRDLYKKCWAVLKPVSSQFTEKGCRPEPRTKRGLSEAHGLAQASRLLKRIGARPESDSSAMPPCSAVHVSRPSSKLRFGDPFGRQVPAHDAHGTVPERDLVRASARMRQHLVQGEALEAWAGPRARRGRHRAPGC